MTRSCPEVARQRTQGAVFWMAAGLVLGTACWLGGNRPVAWTVLSLGLLGLLAVQISADRRCPVAAALRRAAAIFALPFLCVLAWVALQAGPAPVASWAHPAWQALPGRGAVSVDPAATWQGLMRLTAYGAAFWIGARSMGMPQRAAWFLAAFARFSLGLAIFGIAAVVLGANPVTGPSAYPGAVTSVFVNRNSYALYGGLGAMACLGVAVLRLEAGRRGGSAARIHAFQWICGAALMLFAVFLTGSRAGSAATLLGVTSLVALSRRRRWKAVALAAAAAALALALGTDLLIGRLSTGMPFDDKRFAFYRNMAALFWSSPWLGQGLGGFQDAFRAYMPAGFGANEWDFGHSTYLEAGIELGLPAAIASLGVVAAIWRQTWQGVAHRRRARPVLAFALAAMIAAAAHATLDFSVQMPATAALLSLIGGMGWSLARHRAQRRAAPGGGTCRRPAGAVRRPAGRAPFGI